MTDVRISRHHLRRMVIVELKAIDRDIYLDVESSFDEFRINKQAIVRKNPDMAYVQTEFGVFLEQDDILPFMVIMSITGLPRPLKMDDRIIVDSEVYTVSKVKPINREVESVIECLVYPEREGIDLEREMAIDILDVRFRKNEGNVVEELEFAKVVGADTVVMDVMYGGLPTEMSFDGQNWTQFEPSGYTSVPSGTTHLYIKDARGHVAEFNLATDVPEDDELIISTEIEYL